MSDNKNNLINDLNTVLKGHFDFVPTYKALIVADELIKRGWSFNKTTPDKISVERLQTMLYNAILCWFDALSEEYNGIDDEDFIQMVCNEVGIAKDEYLKLMEIN